MITKELIVSRDVTFDEQASSAAAINEKKWTAIIHWSLRVEQDDEEETAVAEEETAITEKATAVAEEEQHVGESEENQPVW